MAPPSPLLAGESWLVVAGAVGVLGVVLVGTAGLFNTQIAAQDAANLTTLSDDDISAYRWEAMAKFYA